MELKDNPEKRRKDLKRLIQKHLINIDEEDISEELSNASEITSTLISRMKQIAGEEEILNAIGKMLITDKGYSTLIAEGSEKCLKILESVKKDLESTEKMASIALNEANEKFKDAEEKFDKFKSKWEDCFGFLRTDAKDLDKHLREEFFDDYGSSIKDEIREKAIEICKEEWNKWSIWPWKWKTYADVNRATERRIKDEFSLLLRSRLEMYRNNIKKSRSFQKDIKNKLTQALEDMRACWEKLQEENDLLSSAIEIISADDIESVTFESFNEKISGTVDAPSYFAQFFITIFTFGVINSNARIEKFFKDNDPAGRAYNDFADDKNTKEDIEEVLGAFRRNYIRELDDYVTNMEKTLKDKIEVQRKFVQEKNTDKERTAKTAQENREKIETYSGDIKKYQQEVKRFYVM